jgi:hypothetical protein
MKRTLAIVLFLITITLVAAGGEPGALTAAGDHGSAQPGPTAPTCTDPPTPCQTAIDNGTCTIPIDWFQSNNHCVGNHKEIKIGKAEKLIIVHTTVIGSFSVDSFKQFPMPGGVCNWQATGTPATPFVDSHVGMSPDHTLTPKVGSNGCYKTNFTLQGGTTIDPHIIVSKN